MDPLKRGNRRLLKLAAHLNTADAKHIRNGEPTYRQSHVIHECGTPACALGHGEQIFPTLRRIGAEYRSSSSWSQSHRFNSLCQEAKRLFHLSEQQVEELFGGYGCARASTGKQAAQYIRNFVKRRTPKA